MKKRLFIAFLVLSFFMGTFLGKAQSTDGTMTITFNQNSQGSKNVLAVWIENGSGTFIKTKMRYWGNGTNDHLPTWKAKSNQNTTDASTGATRTSSTNPTAFGTKTVTWDGKDVNGSSNGTTVPDGTYKVWIESSWGDPPSGQHSTIINFSFTKGTSTDHVTPTGDSYFNNITIDWVPSTTSIANPEKLKQNVTVYPNPASDNINISLSKSFSECKISIENTLGQVVYEEKPTQLNAGTKTINTNSFANGIYFVKIQSKDQVAKFKIVID